MREIIIFTNEDLLQMLDGEKIEMTINNGTKFEFMSEQRFNAMLKEGNKNE